MLSYVFVTFTSYESFDMKGYVLLILSPCSVPKYDHKSNTLILIPANSLDLLSFSVGCTL